VSLIHDFFQDLDRAWTATAAQGIRLPIIGSTALLLQTDYERLTKDSDVLETAELDERIRRQLLNLAGQGSRIHRRHQVYLEVVSPGLPLLPQRPRWVPVIGLSSRLVHFQIDALDVVDVVVSKLKRFHANDQQDIQAMIDIGRVEHDLLLDRFRSAMEVYSLDARAEEELPRCVRNFHRVERDFFLMDETSFDLSSIDR
jgi:hypothetical protein